MKPILSFIAITALFVSFGCSQSQGNGKTVEGANITFREYEHDYGTMAFGADGTYEFIFTNNGTEPLILSTVRSSCGCTVPEWPKQPIAAGEEGKIKVSYNTKISGAFAKSISVYTNALEGPIVLTIRGKVEEADS